MRGLLRSMYDSRTKTFRICQLHIKIETLHDLPLQYHRMLGRNLSKNIPKRFGVCSKHRRNVPVADTPVGFWNPTIADSNDG